MNLENFSLLSHLFDKIVNKSIFTIENRVKCELFFITTVNMLLI